jgi:hypothetical protein
MQPGNPIQGYMKCFAEQSTFFFSKKYAEERGKWLQMPLKELPLDQMRHYGGWPLTQADEAARMDRPDWQVTLPLKREGAYLRLPDVQQARLLATALHVRCRAEIAGRRFDDAVGTFKTVFALSRHFAEHPTLMADLIGINVAYTTLPALEEMLQQPGCPNCYWALTHLPSPFISIYKGVQSERLLDASYTALLDEKEPMTMAQLQKFMGKAQEFLAMSAEDRMPPRDELGKWLKGLVFDAAHVRAARKRLVEGGLDAGRVERFPVLQVVFLDLKRDYETRRDDELGAALLPYWQQPARAARKPADKTGMLIDLVASSRIRLVRLTQVRLEQRLALLRCVEALRLYAAAHDGRLPASLNDLDVPVPIDPVTGKAFSYKLDGQTATLQGTTPPRETEDKHLSWVRYEVTIRK